VKGDVKKGLKESDVIVEGEFGILTSAMGSWNFSP